MKSYKRKKLIKDYLMKKVMMRAEQQLLKTQPMLAGSESSQNEKRKSVKNHNKVVQKLSK
jgi:hypothetical protein